MSEKRFEATAHRLRETRREGDVARSAELSGAAAFIGGLLGVGWAGAALLPALRSLWAQAVDPLAWAEGPDGLANLVVQALLTLARLALPALLLAAACAIVVSYLQVGPVMAWQRIRPQLDRLNPAQGLQRMFAWRNLFALAMLLLKALLLGTVLWFSVRGALDSAVRLGHAPPLKVLDVGGPLAAKLAGWAAVIFLAVAAADFAFQRFDHARRLRMTLEEVKREQRDDQGDPTTRHRRNSLRHELLFSVLPERMKFADAVVHGDGVAVALMRLADGQGAYVVAKGRGEVQAQIRQLAEAAAVSQPHLPALAESLDEFVAVDQTVPAPWAQPLAKALGWSAAPAVVADPPPTEEP